MDSNSNNFVNLSAAIVTVLDSVTQSSAPAFAQVLEYPSFEFSGYPAATIAPSDNTSDYATTVQDFRTYAFFVDLFYLIQDPNNTTAYATAFSNMRILVDTVLFAFDNSNTLNNTCEILTPTPSTWAVIESGNSVMLTARITLNAKVTVTTNNG